MAPETGRSLVAWRPAGLLARVRGLVEPLRLTQVAAAVRALAERPRSPEWLRYQAQQRALALALAPIVDAYARLLRPHHPPAPPDAEALLWRRFEDLLARDWANAEAGLYPKALFFHPPMRDLVAEAPRLLFSGAPERWPGFRRDLELELMLLGTADVLRRMAIPPLVAAARDLARPRIVELGCKSGRLLRQLHAALPRAELVGVDAAPSLIARAREALADVPATLVDERIERTSLPEAAFDAAVLWGALHVIDSDGRRGVLRECRRLLRPGGTLVIVEVLQGDDFFASRFASLRSDAALFSWLRDSLPALLSTCGFARATGEPCGMMELTVARRLDA